MVITRLLTFALVLVAFSSCGGAPPAGPVLVAKVVVEPDSALLLRGETVQLRARVLDADDDPLLGRVVTWVSSDPDVAGVDSTGVVTGVGFGITTVTATADGERGEAAVRVDPMILTIAGAEEGGFGGDGGPATDAQLDFPCIVATATDGSVFIGDAGNNRVRRVDPSGLISTVAGTGLWGFSGDGGQGIQAQLSSPCGLAVDAAGNLYIADRFNARVRLVDLQGIINTVVGTGEPGFSGDGGPATEATLAAPEGLAIDTGGNLYIVDSNNKRVRRVDPSGIITTVAGGGDRRVSGIPATQVELIDPEGVAVDLAGNLYIADLNRLWKVDGSGIITVVSGSGNSRGEGLPAGGARAFPVSVAVDVIGNVYFSESAADRIRWIDPAGIIRTLAGTGERGSGGDGGPASLAEFSSPTGVAVDSEGNLYIADEFNHRIRKLILAE